MLQCYLSLDSIEEDTYPVHLVTWNNFIPETDNQHLMVRFKVGGTTNTATNYRYASQRIVVSSSSDLKSGGDSKIWLNYNSGTGTGESAHGYFYMFNAGDVDRFTQIVYQTASLNSTPYVQEQNGLGTYKVKAVVDGLEFLTSGDDINKIVVSIYGVQHSL